MYCLLLLAAVTTAIPLPASAAPDCTGKEYLSEEFSNGARWEMCWESRIRENLVLSDVHYTPPDGETRRIISTARLSQLHVAYDDSDVTYNDITQFGLGGSYLIQLTEDDCPTGELLTIRTQPALCVWHSPGQDSYRTSTRSVEAESLTLFSVSQVGAYAYIVNWKFYADGAIEPQIGASGALQRSTAQLELPFGRQLQGDDDTLWLSHTHNYYWRLDFDLGESGVDDVVSESNITLSADGRREAVETVFTNEIARRVNPEDGRTWTIWDKLENGTPVEGNTGYRLDPVRAGHRLVRKDIEPYTDYDVFVTVANDCERFASQNARFNPDCLNHVLQYTEDEEPLDNKDIVLWHRVSFHHLPRNEDQRHMHTHWDGFTLEPVNVHAGTPSLDTTQNRTPEIAAISDQSHHIGDNVDIHIDWFDPDGDRVSVQATNLPSGLELIDDEHIHGTANEAGLFNVRLTASDGIGTGTREFEWRIVGDTSDNANEEIPQVAQSVSSGDSFFGHVHWLLILIMSAFVVTRYQSRTRQ